MVLHDINLFFFLSPSEALHGYVHHVIEEFSFLQTVDQILRIILLSHGISLCVTEASVLLLVTLSVQTPRSPSVLEDSAIS